LVEKGVKAKKEYYLGVVIDRAREKVCVIASPEGGVEIEEVARKNPELVMTEYVDTFLGISDYKARKIAKF
jgi:succinyl-CoA synthetase (ADP-forming) beta subunit (EC 6.2.1.5)